MKNKSRCRYCGVFVKAGEYICQKQDCKDHGEYDKADGQWWELYKIGAREKYSYNNSPYSSSATVIALFIFIALLPLVTTTLVPVLLIYTLLFLLVYEISIKPKSKEKK